MSISSLKMNDQNKCKGDVPSDTSDAIPDPSSPSCCIDYFPSKSSLHEQSTTNPSPPLSSASLKYQGRKYQGKSPISDIPELIELCNEMLRTKNITGLAMLARQVGLPPNLRHKIWPLLLKYHPFVQNPYVEIDDDCDEHYGENDEYKIPIKEIKFDLRKYLRSAERYKPKNVTLEIKDMFEIQDKIISVIEQSIVKFLKKWGSIVHYNSALTWIALGLAEWVPPLPNSQFVLCGRDDVAKNGTKLRNINDPYFEKMTNSNFGSSETSSSYMGDSSSSFCPTPDTNRSATSMASPNNTPPLNSKPLSFSELYERLALVILYTPDPSIIENKGKNRHLTIANNIPKDLKNLSLLPYIGGTISDRISFFLFCMRKLLPELHSYLAEEDCLNGDWILWWLKYDGSKVWSRYDRGRTWDLLLGYRTECKKTSYLKELANVLTEEQIRLLGQDIFWNPLDDVDDDDDDDDDVAEDDDIDIENEKMLNKGKIRSSSCGTVIIDDDSAESEINKEYKTDRSLSSRTLKTRKSFSVDKTPTLASLSINSPITPIAAGSMRENDNIDSIPLLDDEKMVIDLPFSKIHPHVEIIFISLAFLKSKEYTITELDQSEIKTLFSKLSSLKSGFDELGSFVSTRSEDDHTSNNNSGSSRESVGSDDNINGNITDNQENINQMIINHRKSNRDIENILIEAGELWRKFLYINMMEDSNLD